ncbi:MAG TPA: tetratricopeptide repeat protein [Terriglobia bacterium]|nr:tetratricopeptide repeat protein [Terriglobia bacterium]
MFNRIFRAAALAVWLMAPVAAMAGNVTVLVLPFENETGDPNLDWLGEGFADMMVDGLKDDPGVHVFTRDERLEAFKKAGIPPTVNVSRATAIHLGWEIGADVVILGAMSGKPADFGAQARMINLEALDVSDGSRVSGKLDDVMQLGSTLAAGVGRKLTRESTAPASSAAPGLPSPSAFEKFVRGLLSEDPANRVRLLKDAVRLHSEYSAAIFALGRTYHATHDYATSRQWLERVGVGDPDYLEARYLQGLNAYYSGDYESAVSIFANLPPHHDTFMNLGAALARAGDPAAAVAAWRRAADLDPMVSDTFFNLGYLSLTQGDSGGAIRYLEQFFKLEGRDAEAMFILGKAYDRAGRPEEAQRTVAEALRLSPRLERWNAQLPDGLERLSSEFPRVLVPGARTVWSASRLERRAASQDVNALLAAASKLIDTTFYGAATRQLKEILSLFPKSAETHEMLAHIYDLQRDYAGAIRELQASVSLEPSANAYVKLARIYRAANQPDRAFSAANEALTLDPRNPAALTLKTDLERAQTARPARRQP